MTYNPLINERDMKQKAISRTTMGTLLLAACMSLLAACQSDSELTAALLVGQWEGDLAFRDKPTADWPEGEPLVSRLTLFDGGTGGDQQYRAGYGSQLVYSEPLTWSLEHARLRLLYTRWTPVRVVEIGGLYADGDRISGTLYVDGAQLGSVTLTRR